MSAVKVGDTSPGGESCSPGSVCRCLPPPPPPPPLPRQTNRRRENATDKPSAQSVYVCVCECVCVNDECKYVMHIVKRFWLKAFINCIIHH